MYTERINIMHNLAIGLLAIGTWILSFFIVFIGSAIYMRDKGANRYTVAAHEEAKLFMLFSVVVATGIVCLVLTFCLW